MEFTGVLSGELHHTDALLRNLARMHSRIKFWHSICVKFTFYMGKQAQLQQRQNTALSYFRLSLSNNVQSFLEHRFARLEIERISGALHDPKEQTQALKKAL